MSKLQLPSTTSASTANQSISMSSLINEARKPEVVEVVQPNENTNLNNLVKRWMPKWVFVRVSNLKAFMQAVFINFIFIFQPPNMSLEQ